MKMTNKKRPAVMLALKFALEGRGTSGLKSVLMPLIYSVEPRIAVMAVTTPKNNNLLNNLVLLT